MSIVEREILYSSQANLVHQRHVLVHELKTMNRLHSIATRFVQEADVSAIFLEIIDAAMSITNADKGSILLADEKNQGLKITASRGFDVPFLDYFANCPPGEGACGTAFQKNERVLINDITEDERFIGTPYLTQLLAKEITAVQATPLKSRTGKVLGVLATYYKSPGAPKPRELRMVDLLARLSADIIERGQWIAERAILVEKLREADKRKNEFLAVLSHELRNPLASISNSAILLSYNMSDCKTVQNAQAIINRQVAQITRLVDDLLDITRITENKVQLEFQKIDINELVFRIVEDNRPIFERSGLALKVQLSDVPILVNADSLRIEQVINNLLHNASKFSTYGGMTQVIVEINELTNDAIISVIDDGIGIESSFLGHLFEPFTQADSSLGRAQNGLGLGLALVKGIIELHGGSVHAKSQGLGFGTQFIVILPIAIHAIPKKNEAGQKTLKETPKRTILIIDDNQDVRESLRILLETLGHVVDDAATGLEGLEKARQIKPEFVLCDIGLPELNGYQVASAFRADPLISSTYLIALSGYAQSEEIDQAIKAGFDVHLAKPPNFDLLENILACEK